MLQSSAAGCIELASLVGQTLSPPSTSSRPHPWHTPTVQYVILCRSLFIRVHMYMYIELAITMCPGFLLHGTVEVLQVATFEPLYSQ